MTLRFPILCLALTTVIASMPCGIALAEKGVAEKEEPASVQKEGTQKEVAKKADAKNETKSEKKEVDQAAEELRRIAGITLKGGLPETTSTEGLFGDTEANLRDVIQRLKDATDDDEIEAIVLRIRNPSLGRGRLNELRAAIQATRHKGKPVYAQLEMGTTADYLVACACDKIIMPPPAVLLVPGVRAEVTFYKRLLDKLDIHADILQMGDFKGAGEPMTREAMSEPFRQQYEMLLDDLYGQLVHDISVARTLPQSKVKTLVDQGLFTAEQALEAGLIDLVQYEDQWASELLKTCAKNIEIVENYGKEEVDTDFSGMAGFIKFLDLLSGGDGEAVKSKAKKKIAIVYAVGAIQSGKSQGGSMGGTIMGSDTIIEALDTANDDEDIAAIVLRVDSPGGSALASDLIWRKIEQIQKPIVASMGDVAASGGYYISMGCDKIFAEPGTITGSIGVVGGKVAVGKTMEKLGLTTDVLSRGKNSGLFSTLRPFSDSEREAAKSMMQETYKQFTEKAAVGRGMKVEEILPLAGGRIWTGTRAQENGLVDAVGTIEAAIDSAKDLAGIDSAEETEILVLPEPRSFMDELIGNDASSGVTARIAADLPTATLQALLPQMAQAIGQVQVMGTLLSEQPIVLMMPYHVEIK